MNYRRSKSSKSMHTVLVQDLGTQIVSGQLQPGQKLPSEASLCEKYSISRPVFREAIRVLTAKGLVYARPRLGTLVRPRRDWHMLDPDVLHWLMQTTPQQEFFNTLSCVRWIIEPTTVALAATHATPEDLQAIEAAYQQMEAASSHEERLQPDLDFHNRIADATHNDLLAYLNNMLSLALRESMRYSNQHPNFDELALPRHKAILTAIQNRDPLGARHASLVQLEEARLALSKVLGHDLIQSGQLQI